MKTAMQGRPQAITPPGALPNVQSFQDIQDLKNIKDDKSAHAAPSIKPQDAQDASSVFSALPAAAQTNDTLSAGVIAIFTALIALATAVLLFVIFSRRNK